MSELLRHRGPDDDMLISSTGFALAARRLSIVDVEGGRQPVANEAETVWAVQNGELYNFAAVREQLVAGGHVLHTRCDSEILPHVYEEAGTDLPGRIDGMFALAIWDDERGRGLLARDRTGKKPLYWLEHDGALWFASEIKSLLTVPGFERRVDRLALHDYLGLKHVPSPRTIFEGIHCLPPASMLVWERGVPPRVARYWRPNFDTDSAAPSPDEAAERLLLLLREAVRKRLMGDVPIGFFLSGGIDSSLTTALAAEEAAGPVKTFTLTYGDRSTTEGKEQDRRWARWVAERWQTEHHEETVDFQHFPDTIRPILRCFDEPFAGVVSTYFLSQLIGRHVKVAVSGDGADELFGSYRSHRIAAGAEAPPFDGPDWMWRAELLVLSDAEKASLYATSDAAALRPTSDYIHGLFADLTARDPLNRMLEAEFLSVFPDQVLAFVDRLSMAHSLEVRSAYLDTDVVEYVASLPGDLKIREGDTKHLLKLAASQYFPPEMVQRPKEGFVMPVTDWLLNDLEPYVRDTLAPSALARHGIFDAQGVARLVDGYYRDRGDYRYGNKILALVVFQEWHDMYMAL
jgi:asparagine synthase (glutamine-hydrolysing)